MKLLFEIRKLWFCPCSPEPETVSRIQSLFLPFLINGMIRQNLITFLLQIHQNLLSCHIVSNNLSPDIMGRRKGNHHTLFPNQAMAVAGSHIKLENFILKFPLHCIQKFFCFLSTDFICTVVQNMLFLIDFFLFRKSHQVCPDGNVSLFQINSYIQSL